MLYIDNILCYNAFGAAKAAGGLINDLRNEVTDMSKLLFVIITIIIILLLTSGNAA